MRGCDGLDHALHWRRRGPVGYGLVAIDVTFDLTIGWRRTMRAVLPLATIHAAGIVVTVLRIAIGPIRTLDAVGPFPAIATIATAIPIRTVATLIPAAVVAVLAVSLLAHAWTKLAVAIAMLAVALITALLTALLTAVIPALVSGIITAMLAIAALIAVLILLLAWPVVRPALRLIEHAGLRLAAAHRHRRSVHFILVAVVLAHVGAGIKALRPRASKLSTAVRAGVGAFPALLDLLLAEGQNDPVVMLGVLQIVLRQHWVSRRQCIPCKGHVFLGDLRRRAVNFLIRAVGLVGPHQRIMMMLAFAALHIIIAIGATAASAVLLLSLPHGTLFS